MALGPKSCASLTCAIAGKLCNIIHGTNYQPSWTEVQTDSFLSVYLVIVNTIESATAVQNMQNRHHQEIVYSVFEPE